MARKTSPRIAKYRRQSRTGKHDTAFVVIEGHRTYLGRYGTPESREQYHKLLAERAVSGSSLPVADGVTITEVVAAHWKYAQDYYANAPTELDRIRTISRIITRVYGSCEARNFGPLALKACRQSLVEAGNCRRQVNQQTVRMRRMFKWAVAQEMIPPTVLVGLQAVGGLRRGHTKAIDHDPVGPVCDEHVNAIKAYVSRPVWAMIELQRLTGMRPGEVAIMRRADIDTTGTVWTYRPSKHKTQNLGFVRVVELGPRAQLVLVSFLNGAVKSPLFSPRRATAERYAAAKTHRRSTQKPNVRKTDRKISDSYTVDSYRRAIQYGCDRADLEAKKASDLPSDSDRIIPRWHPHQLRHTAATRFRKEYGIEVARVLLGHRTAFTTEIYAQTDRSKAADVMAAIG